MTGNGPEVSNGAPNAEQCSAPHPNPNLMLDRVIRLIVLDRLTTQEMVLVRSLKQRRKRSQVIDVTNAEFEQVKVIHDKIFNRIGR